MSTVLVEPNPEELPRTQGSLRFEDWWASHVDRTHREVNVSLRRQLSPQQRRRHRELRDTGIIPSQGDRQ